MTSFALKERKKALSQDDRHSFSKQRSEIILTIRIQATTDFFLLSVFTEVRHGPSGD